LTDDLRRIAVSGTSSWKDSRRISFIAEASPATAQTAPGDNAGAQRAPPIQLPPLRSAGIGSNILHRTERHV
jgi:hypothetical protein